MKNPAKLILRLTGLLKQRTPLLEPAELRGFVSKFLDRRHQYLERAVHTGSPLYLLDKASLVSRVGQFNAAFRKVLPNVTIMYAMKSNNCPEVARILIDAGCGLDVSSGAELAVALELGATQIVFSGPGKTDQELDLAVANSQCVTVLVDSFGELQRLEKVAEAAGRSIFAGVRVTVDETSIWRKFGIPLADLPAFFEKADKCSHISLGGVQFHLSWNLNPENYVKFLGRLGEAFRNLVPAARQSIEFIDIGGGYWPPEGEWLQPAGTREGMLHNALMPTSDIPDKHYKQASVSIDHFAHEIAAAMRVHLPADMNYRVYTEPGRWICNDAMHILLTVVDKKAPDLVITDGGTNAIGWERFESDYFPIINLTRPGLTERKCLIAGSLCTPHDIWGYGYWGEDIRPGDILLVPNQGAYTYSLRQEFIKPLPKVTYLKEISTVDRVDNRKDSTRAN